MKLKEKIITIITTTVLLGGYFLPIGNLAIAAAVQNLEEQTVQTQNENVEFNVRLSNNTHEQEYNISEGGKVYIEFNIKENGYLKNGIVEFSDCNYKINSDQINTEYIQKIENNTVYLNQINNKQTLLLELPISFEKEEYVNETIFNQNSKAKLTGTYVDTKGTQTTLTKEITNKIKWKAEPESKVNAEITKYIPYNLEGEYGVLVQAKVTSSVKDSVLPIKNTSLKISVPTINEKQPDDVKVIANKTTATNGEETGLNFTSKNYEYTKEESEVTINTQNTPNEQGKIAWKDGEDEYLINYIYKGQEVYNNATQLLNTAQGTKVTEEQAKNGAENDNAIKLETKVNGTITTYGSEGKTINLADSTFESSIQEQKGELVDFTAKSVQTLSKGYIYANYAKTSEQLAQEPEKTNYEITYTAQINNKEIVNEVKFKTNEEKLVAGSNNRGVGTNIITSSVKVSEEIFKKILGEQGQIQVLNNSEVVLGTITSESQKDEEGNYVLNIEEKNTNEVTIKTTAPESEGTLEVKVEKSFKPNQSFSQEEMKTFTKMTVKADLETNANNKTQNIEIELQEPVSKAEISIEESKKNLSTVVANENVKINVVLDTSSVQNALYKNPLIEILMPEQVEDVKIKDAYILLDDELQIKSKEIIENQDSKYIILQLEGTQTKYQNYINNEEQNVIAKGANIVVIADITVDKLATSSAEKMYLYYQNANTNLYEKTEKDEENRVYGTSETDVIISAPAGVIATNSVSGYDGEDSKLTNIEQEILKANIPTNAKQKTVKFEGSIINNYENSITNTYILGRLPFEGNQKIDKNEDLGSNFTMSMNGAIQVTGIDLSQVKVYYSTEEDVAKSLLDSGNETWQENPKNYTNIKSYLIVINGEISHGTQIHFEYEANIPANLVHNKSAYTSYKVYYNNRIPETKEAGIVGLTTGNGPEVEIKLSSEVPENSQVKEWQMVKFYAEIKNIGEEDLTNAVLNIPVPEEAIYVEYDFETYTFAENMEPTVQIKIGEIKAGETKTISYILRMKKDYEGQVSNIVNLTVDNMPNPAISNEYIINLVEGKIGLTLTARRDYTLPAYKGDTLIAYVSVEALDDLNNAKVTIDIPEGIKINEATCYNMDYEDINCIKIQNNQIIAEMGKMADQYINYIVIELQIENFKGDFKLVAKGREQNFEEQTSNEIVYHVCVPEFEINQSSSAKYIKEKEEITYEFIVKNVGKDEAPYVTFEDKLPKQLLFKKLEYTYNGETQVIDTCTDNSPIVYWPLFEKDAEATIKITASAKLLEEDIKEVEVNNIGTITSQENDPQSSNSITTIIQRNQELYGEEPGSDSQITDDRAQYTISGIAWLDENKNGQRENTEELLPGIEVILLKKQNGEIVQNIEDGKEKTTTTNSNGEYKFENLKGGEYIVVFCYDTAQYNTTDYQKQNVNSNYNSDAVSMLVTLNGRKAYAGVTNTIKITNKDIQNIDIGLYISQKFDLKLDKYISKITVNTPSSGVKTYKVNNSQLEKVEIKSRDVGKSNIIIEYTIVVTNEGRLAGYARKIVDYLPKNVRFNSELNNDWYATDDNNTVYNASLQNTLINPGESKTIKLVLSAQITNSNIGTIINNNAEIYESYNEYGEHDMDSIEANRADGEDDMSKADIILSTATGTIVIYATLALVVILIIIIGVILIKRKFEKIEL